MSADTQAYQFQLSLTVVAPFLSHKAGAQQFGYDMSMLKHQGHPVFLGSLIRGNLRHALLYFKSTLEETKQHADLVEEIKEVLGWFGKASENTNNEANRANFKFDYYWQINNAKDIPINPIPRYRIGIDPKTGTVEQGNLQIIEATYRQGQCVEFEGVIQAQLNLTQANFAAKWIKKAAAYIPAIGALKGTGFGQIKQVTLSKTEKQPEIPVETINSDRIGICLTLDRPLCIAKPHIPNHNRFSSEEFIPGNVILGTIAQQYSNELKGQSWFDKLSITHALPADNTKPERKPVLPLSLVTIAHNNTTTAVDLALSVPEPGKAVMINIEGTRVPPTYQSDWKKSDTDAVEIACEQKPEKDYQLSRQLIVRTAIDEGSNNAKKSALFSLDCISPENTDWCADIEFSAIKDSEKEAARALVSKVIANGLQGLGKTKASATLIKQPPFTQTEQIERIEKNEKTLVYIITLQTPARLFPAPNAHFKINATADAESLKKCYQDYWQAVSGYTLTLSHYYAQQSKVGGAFYHRYYQQGATYQPEWLTAAGSVFILTADKDFDETLLKTWLKQGLDQAKDKENSHWKNNPYIRQNGFGEIRINDAIHTRLSLDTLQLQGEWL